MLDIMASCYTIETKRIESKRKEQTEPNAPTKPNRIEPNQTNRTNRTADLVLGGWFGGGGALPNF